MLGFSRLSTIALLVGQLVAAQDSANYWFGFGDSYTQTGFNYAGILPAPGNPLGNPPYPGWTSTGGPNWVGTFATSLNNSLLLTYNYAHGGAVIDADLVTPWQPDVITMTDQINDLFFAPNGAGSKPAETPWTSENSLFSVWIGINDIGNSFYLGGDRAAFSKVLLDAEFRLVERLYEAGARNFLFVNVPATHRSPTFLESPPSNQALIQSVLETHNQLYATYIEEFAASHEDVTTWLWDSYASFNKILDSLETYGFNPDPLAWGGANDFWGDNYHPSSLGHTALADDVRTTLANTRW